ncbi:hypothetical protein NL676_025657 [Syzygium grande]|nr:hypothetical protein NL676_025657 [Syzygium grande]
MMRIGIAWLRKRFYTIVWVDEGRPQLKSHPYLSWCFRDQIDFYGPLRTLDVPFDGLGRWNLHAVDGKVVSPDSVSEADSNPQPVIIEFDLDSELEEPMEWESDPEPEPMEFESEPEEDLEEVPEPKDDPEGKPL